MLLNLHLMFVSAHLKSGSFSYKSSHLYQVHGNKSSGSWIVGSVPLHLCTYQKQGDSPVDPFTAYNQASEIVYFGYPTTVVNIFAGQQQRSEYKNGMAGYCIFHQRSPCEGLLSISNQSATCLLPPSVKPLSR